MQWIVGSTSAYGETIKFWINWNLNYITHMWTWFVIYFNKLIQSNERKWATSKKLIIMFLLLLKYCHFGLHFVHIGYFQCLKKKFVLIDGIFYNILDFKYCDNIWWKYEISTYIAYLNTISLHRQHVCHGNLSIYGIHNI